MRGRIKALRAKSIRSGVLFKVPQTDLWVERVVLNALVTRLGRLIFAPSTTHQPSSCGSGPIHPQQSLRIPEIWYAPCGLAERGTSVVLMARPTGGHPPSRSYGVTSRPASGGLQPITSHPTFGRRGDLRRGRLTTNHPGIRDSASVAE